MVANIAAARLLGPEQAGHLAYLVWAAESLILVSGLGLPPAVTTFVAELRGAGQNNAARFVTRWTYSIYLLLAVCGSIFGYLVAAGTPAARTSPALPIATASYLFLAAAVAYHVAYLAGTQAFRRIARINAVSAILLISAVPGLAMRFGVTGAMCGYAIGALPGALAWVRRSGGAGTDATVQGLPGRVVRYALFAWYGTVMAAVTWSRAEVYFVERYWGATQVSMFTVGVTLSLIATQGPTLLVSAMLPQFAQLRGAGQREEIARLFAAATRLMSLLLFPSCLGLATLVPVLLPLVYGEAFRPAVPNAVVLIAFSLVAFSSVSSSLLFGMEKSRVIAALSTAGGIATLLAGSVVISRYGAWGAVWSRAGVQVFAVGLTLVYIERKLQVSVPWADLLRILAAASTCALVSAGVVWMSGGRIYALASIPISVAIYLLCLRWLRVLGESDLQLFARPLRRFPPVAEKAGLRVVHWLVRR